MSKEEPQLVLDSFARVLSHVMLVIFIMLVAGILHPLASGSENLFALMVELWLDWYAWRDPIPFISALAPVAIALQVGAHTLKSDRHSHSNPYEVKRGLAFSILASIVAAAILVFTFFTVLRGPLSGDASFNEPAIITTIIIGITIAILCIDAARLATTQELQARIPQARHLYEVRASQLDQLQNSQPSFTSTWIASGVTLFISISVSVAYWLLTEAYFNTPIDPRMADEVIIMVAAMSLVFLVLLLVILVYYFGIFVIFASLITEKADKSISAIGGTFACLPPFWIAIELMEDLINGRALNSALFMLLFYMFIGLTSTTLAWMRRSPSQASKKLRPSIGLDALFYRLAGNLSKFLFDRCNSRLIWLNTVSGKQRNFNGGAQRNRLGHGLQPNRIKRAAKRGSHY